jgi:hypothetical protein
MNDIRKLIEAIEEINEVSDFDGDALDTLIAQFEETATALGIVGNPVKERELTQVVLARAFEGVTDLGESEAILGTDNDEASEHLEQVGKALARAACEQAAGVWDEEGREMGGYDTGAKTGKEYVRYAAPRFLDKEYKGAIMRELEGHFNEYVEYFLDYIDAGAEPDWDNME